MLVEVVDSLVAPIPPHPPETGNLGWRWKKSLEILRVGQCWFTFTPGESYISFHVTRHTPAFPCWSRIPSTPRVICHSHDWGVIYTLSFCKALIYCYLQSTIVVPNLQYSEFAMLCKYFTSLQTTRRLEKVEVKFLTATYRWRVTAVGPDGVIARASSTDFSTLDGEGDNYSRPWFL
jgi:hypothetical protein